MRSRLRGANASEALQAKDVLRSVEGFSLEGLNSLVDADAIRLMPFLRILIMNGVALTKPMAGFGLPRLANVTWRSGVGRALPFKPQKIKTAAVLHIQGSRELTELPADMQALSRL
ncbi:hypothetical protein WJX81_007308 [Elliptochloris bilobata]|uniref:Uncharacterized protein n=1 Tax=Elliptochloris bilobata TaxID=381761 RepID=A0AAW1SDR1_9CHLO